MDWLSCDSGQQSVGTCGFKSPPENGEVEIAYFTFPEFEGTGVATEMASRLVEVATEYSAIRPIAQTLVDRNASHRILEKTGFVAVETIVQPEDGKVLVWRRNV